MLGARKIISTVLLGFIAVSVMSGCIAFRPVSPDDTPDTGLTTTSESTVTRTEPTPPTEPEPTKPTPPTEPEPTKPTPPTEPEPTKPAPPTEPEPTKPAPPTEPEPTKPAPPTEPEPTKPAPPTEPEPTKPTPPAEPEPTKPAPSYVVVPESDRVDESYFSNGTLFIGDSLTTGLPLYHVINSSFYCVESISTYNILTSRFIDRDGVMLTLPEALSSDGNKWKRIYIQLGVNEIWSTADSFAGGYGKLIDALKTYCPDATIYVQSVFPMTESASSGTYSQYGGNAKLREFNSKLIELCTKRGLYYVNVYEILDDGTGALNASYAGSDGVHIPPSTYKLWVDYLFTHTAK